MRKSTAGSTDRFTFETASGAVYTVFDGLISREEGRTPIIDRATGKPLPSDTVLARPFYWLHRPVVGERAVYVLTEPDSDGPHGGGYPVYTSTVESVDTSTFEALD